MKSSLHIGISILLGLFAGCSGPQHHNQTAKDWSNGNYVSSDEASTRSEHAARVLDRAPEKTDVTMQVRTLRLPVHSLPDLDSKVIGNLDRGDAVTVLEWSRFYNAPSTDHDADTEAGRGVPTWAKVSNARIEGYVSARSLASPSDYAPSNSIAPNAEVLLSGSKGTPAIEGASYSSFEELMGTAPHPVTCYRQSRLVLEGWEPAMLERARIDGFASVSLEEHDGERSMIERRMENIVQPMPPLEPELLAADSEGSFIDPDRIRGYLRARALETYLESDGFDPDLHLIVARELGSSMLATGDRVPADDPRSIIVNAVGSELARHSSKPYPDAGYAFILIDNDEIAEAVATPIGIIFLTTGMLDLIESDSELALVLGHEIGHVEGGHGLGTDWGEGGDHFDRFSAYRRVLALEAAGELDGHIDWVMADIEVPEDFKESVRQEIRETLVSEARTRYLAGMENAMSELRHGSNRELEIAADARAMSLASAGGYDPKRILVLLDRFDATPVAYGGARYPRARRMAATEILDQIAGAANRGETPAGAPTGIDRDILITCLENDLTHEEIRERAMPALDDSRATLMSEKVVMVEFTPPSEEPEAPVATGTSLRALLAPPAEPEIAAAEPEAGTSTPTSEGADADTVGTAAAREEETENEQPEPTTVVATIIDGPADEDSTPQSDVSDPVVEEDQREVAMETEAPAEVPMTPLEPARVEEEEEPTAETPARPEVVFDPEHFTRFVDRTEFNRQATPTERSMFAAFISRHPEKTARFLRFSIRGHSELTIEGPFTDDSLALVIPENRRLSLWCVRGGSKHRVPDTQGSAHRLDSEDGSLSLVNTTAEPIEGWVVLGR
ncbi:MAG: M48 family metalloprotease [Planctomycetota bacterium]|nr:M48 family metalloprotease [Planctomycetota bacterium]